MAKLLILGYSTFSSNCCWAQTIIFNKFGRRASFSCKALGNQVCLKCQTTTKYRSICWIPCMLQWWRQTWDVHHLSESLPMACLSIMLISVMYLRKCRDNWRGLLPPQKTRQNRVSRCWLPMIIFSTEPVYIYFCTNLVTKGFLCIHKARVPCHICLLYQDNKKFTWFCTVSMIALRPLAVFCLCDMSMRSATGLEDTSGKASNVIVRSAF